MYLNISLVLVVLLGNYKLVILREETKTYKRINTVANRIKPYDKVLSRKRARCIEVPPPVTCYGCYSIHYTNYIHTYKSVVNRNMLYNKGRVRDKIQYINKIITNYQYKI